MSEGLSQRQQQGRTLVRAPLSPGPEGQQEAQSCRALGQTRGHLPEPPPERSLWQQSTFPALHGVSNTDLCTQRCSFAKGFHKLTFSSGFLLQNLPNISLLSKLQALRESWKPRLLFSESI